MRIDPDLRAYYEFYGAHMEPWDGPAGLVLTDGRYAVCTTDRNGLRPARYVITRDRHLTVASEIGVWDYKPEDVVRKGRMGPGQMLALDLSTGTLLENSDIDELLKERHPYKAWLKKGIRHLHAGPGRSVAGGRAVRPRDAGACTRRCSTSPPKSAMR